MPLLNVEMALLTNALNFIHKARHLQPKQVEAKVIEPDMRDCGCGQSDYDANKQSMCTGCLEEEKRLGVGDDRPEPIFYGDQPTPSSYL